MAAGLTLAFYLVWVISGQSENWQWLVNVSIFAASELQHALANGSLNLLHVGVLVGLGLVCTIAALTVFRRGEATSSQASWSILTMRIVHCGQDLPDFLRYI